MTECVRPLDPIDCEALAASDAPVFAPDAAVHAAGCEACSGAVESARVLLRELEGTLDGAGAPGGRPDLASRVVRIRPFSRRELTSPSLWSGPVAFSGVLFAAGSLIAGAPGLTAGEQASLGLAAAAPMAGIFRAAWRALADTVAAAPVGWQALSDVARAESLVGVAALLLLAPAGFALSRVLARSRRRG
ncbi:MAG: hypothetical protein ABI592_02795 [Acidobacteriota bacterium]